MNDLRMRDEHHARTRGAAVSDGGECDFLQSIAFAVDGKRWSAVGGPGVALGTLTSAAASTTATRAPILAAVPFRRLASRFCGRRREGIGIDSGTEIFSRGYSDWR